MDYTDMQSKHNGDRDDGIRTWSQEFAIGMVINNVETLEMYATNVDNHPKSMPEFSGAVVMFKSVSGGLGFWRVGITDMVVDGTETTAVIAYETLRTQAEAIDLFSEIVAGAEWVAQAYTTLSATLLFGMFVEGMDRDR